MWRHIEMELQLCSADQNNLPKHLFIFYTLSASSTIYIHGCFRITSYSNVHVAGHSEIMQTPHRTASERSCLL